MGSFIGHAIPGSFFFLFGSWWIIAIFYRYHKSRSKTSVQPFRSSPSFSSSRINIEGILGISAALIGMFVEIFMACIFKGRPVNIGNMQHATMYFFFGMFSMSVLFSRLMKRHFEEADKVVYILMASAILVEGMLFKFHLYGRPPLDVVVHTLLLYTIWISAAMALGEMVYRDSVLLALGRAFFCVLQGTWFWQVAFILYNPLPGAKAWDEDNHHLLMLVACFYSWHVVAILCVMMFICFFTSKFVERRQVNIIVSQEMAMHESEQCTLLLNDQDE